MYAFRRSESNTHAAGSRYEEAAAAYLTAQGMTILRRNFRSRFGEIDIIARDGRTVVFVEVKFRSSDRAGDPLEAVGPGKQKRIILAAMYYIASVRGSMDVPYRFDVVGILGDGTIKHVRGAFSAFS